jgi:hypothetical protein
MAEGWDVLLQGEACARGRMVWGQSVIRGELRCREQLLGIRFSCDVYCESGPGLADLGESGVEAESGSGLGEDLLGAVA